MNYIIDLLFIIFCLVCLCIIYWQLKQNDISDNMIFYKISLLIIVAFLIFWFILSILLESNTTLNIDKKFIIPNVLTE